MKYDLNEVRQYLELLSGESNPVVSWQLYYDPKGLKAPKGLSQAFHGKLNDSLDYFNQMQELKCGVYASVNLTNGKSRLEEDIVKKRFFVADWDGSKPPPFCAPPTFTTKRDETHVHAYWAVSGDCSHEEYSQIQKRISIYHNSDPKILNPAQVLRVSGFVHYKDINSPQMYRISEINAGASYTVAEMIDFTPLSASQDAVFNHWVKNKEGIKTGSGFEKSKRYESLFKKWLISTAPPAVEGGDGSGSDGGTGTLIKVCHYGRDRALHLDVVQKLMWEHYNERCIPPWEENERWHFNQTIANAYEYATSEVGCRTAIGGFSARPDLPERTDGWKEKPKELKVETVEELPDRIELYGKNIPDNKRITREEAELLQTNLTDKTPHYDLAKYFDGMVYDGREIYRCDKIYYVFNGRTYDVVGDDVIEAKIQSLLYSIKPSIGTVKSILGSHCNLVNRPNLENGTWLNEPERESKNISVFRNGIVDLSKDELVLEKHTYLYFSFNERNYDYNPLAVAPVWNAFLDQIFEHDMKCKTLLLEFIGLCLVHELKFQKFLFLLGVSRGGKGIVTNTIRHIVGINNCANPPLQSIYKDHVLHSLHDKAVGFVNDVRSVPLNVRETCLSTLLQITGGDPQTFDVKFKPAQSCEIPARLIMTANVPPDFMDASGALVARMLVIKFQKSFKGKENLNLGSDILKELSGINNMAIKAYREVLKRGHFTEPQSSVEEKQEMKDEMFPLSGFVNDCCVVSSESVCSVNQLFKAYLLHSNLNATKSTMTKIKFTKSFNNCELNLSMSRKTVDKIKESYFTGIKLNDKTEESINLGNVTQFKNRNI